MVEGLIGDTDAKLGLPEVSIDGLINGLMPDTEDVSNRMKGVWDYFMGMMFDGSSDQAQSKSLNGTYIKKKN